MVMRMRTFFAAHPRLYDVVLIGWVLLVTAATIYTFANWK